MSFAMPTFDRFTDWGVSWLSSSGWFSKKEAPKAPEELIQGAGNDADSLVVESDRYLAITNVKHLGLELLKLPPIAHFLLGLPSLQKQIHLWKSIPKEDSLIKKVLLFPILPNIAGAIYPLFGIFQQAVVSYPIARNAIAKLTKAMEKFREDPMATLLNPRETIEALAIHLINLSIEAWWAKNACGKLAWRDLEPITQFMPRRGNWGAETCPKPFSPFEASNCTFTGCRPIAKVNMPCDGCGMFSVHLYMLGVLDRFDRGEYSGIEIDFGDQGVYYTPARGPNWFEDFYCPVNIRDPRCPNALETSFSFHEYIDMRDTAEGGKHLFPPRDGLSSQRVKELAGKYLYLRPEIQREISTFESTHFPPDCLRLGVHYRGTDKPTSGQARRVGYEEMMTPIHEAFRNISLVEPTRKVKIFGMSDEQPFIDFLQTQFPGQVVVSPATRSSGYEAVHLYAKNPYQVGKEVMMDARILEGSDMIIRTSSCVSAYASRMAKEGTPVIEVSQRRSYF